MYLSYLMGAEKISNDELASLGIEIVETTPKGDRKLKIPASAIAKYEKLIKEKMTAGFWNEYIGKKEIKFIFKLETDEIKEYLLSPENEQEIDDLCAKLNNEPPDKTANVYKYISENDFYRDFMHAHYQEMIERQAKIPKI